MKMRFWQKTYIFTLVLFLVSMNIGILSLTVYTYGKNVEAADTTAKAEQYYIVQNFERDYDDLITSNDENTSPVLLMQSYGTYYKDKGIMLAFKEGEDEKYSNIKDEYEIGKNKLLHLGLGGKRHIIISDDICDGKIEMIFAKDVSSLDSECSSLMLAYVLTAAGVSLILATVLYFVLKKLSEPLEKLRRTTELIEAGDYTVTAEETGNDEFALLARSFNSMIGKINEQMATLALDAKKKQMLVDNLAHELRTPLTSIQGYAEYLEKASSSEENRILSARYIMSESKRLQRISDILLDGAYIRGRAPEMTDVDVGEVIRDVSDKLQLKAKGSDVALVCENTSLYVIGNETLLSMLFYNLTENAIKACKAGDKVRLYTEGSTVSVEDSGKGMSPDELLHITEPFYRTDKSRSRGEGGAGLGLALCKQIAETHGGSLDFESEKGNGTTARVTFTSLKQV